MIKCAKKKRWELGIVFVETTKAFNTICHQQSIRGLVQWGVNPHAVHLVCKIYENIVMYLDTKKEKTDPIKMLTGVEQGYPMSLLLLNLALDPLLCKLGRFLSRRIENYCHGLCSWFSAAEWLLGWYVCEHQDPGDLLWTFWSQDTGRSVMAFTSNQQRTHIPSMIVTSYDQCLGDKRHPPP